MRFSVLVPVYNKEAYLDACIGSVLNQTFTDWELLLVDDGSTDGSGALCDGYAAAHPGQIRVIHQENTGLISARRRGIREAAGEMCVFLDGDDWLCTDCLEKIASYADRTHAQMVLYLYQDCFPNGTVVPSAPVFLDGEVFQGEGKRRLYGELIRSWRLNNLCTKAIASAFVKEDDTDYAAYLDNANTEDLLQTLYPITHAKTVVYLAAPLYNYRRLPDSISAKAEKGAIAAQFNEPVMARLRSYMTLWGMDTREWLLAYHTRRLFGITALFWQHYRAAKNREERKSVIEYPWQRHITEEDRLFLGDNGLSKSRKMQLKAILEKRRIWIAAFAWIGGARMRRKHGES